MYDYTKLKNDVEKHQKKKKKKKKTVYSADGKHFKFDRIKNFFISVNKPKNTKKKLYNFYEK